MKERLLFVYQLLRMKHWSKQAFVFLGFIFYPTWGDTLYKVFYAAIIFCIAASSVYIFNDIKDIDLDKQHALKRYRPIAKGDISISEAYILLYLLSAASLVLAAFISAKAVLIIAAYFVVNIFYSNGLKHIPYIDVLCLSQGFLLRILMGTWAVGIPPSSYILICGTALSLFLAISKRKLEWNKSESEKGSSRPVLQFYTQTILNRLLGLSAVVFLGSYLSYAVTNSYFRAPYHPLVLTIPFVLIGFIRYIRLMNVYNTKDCPLSLFLHDKLSVINLLCMLFMCIKILHL